MIEPSAASKQMLARHGVSPSVINAAGRLIRCIELACDDVAETTGEDLYDDATSSGLLRHFRSRNRAIEEFADDGEVVTNTEQNTLDLLIDGSKIKFYSARNGIDSPNLLGGSRMKKSVVTEMQMQLDYGDVETTIARRLVLMYEADDRGLQAAALGVMANENAWSWHATMFERASTLSEASSPAETPAYDEQVEPELPPIEKRQEPLRRSGEDETK